MPAGDPGSPRWSFPGPGTCPGTGQVLSEQANWMNGFIPPDPQPWWEEEGTGRTSGGRGRSLGAREG